MGTMSYAQVPPTAATIALNAYIFGFGGHSLVTPHAALRQLWWTDDRIESRVTRKFVVSQIKGEERDFLDKPLAFGEGLTDDTYMEWILGRSRRLFLVLSEIGKPEQIFGLIDDSLDDDDLPFTLDSIAAMDLSIEPDERLNKRFYATQFLYLLRQLKPGGHIDYGPQEHIPMEKVHKVPPAVALQSWDRIHFPQHPEQVFLRRKFNFGGGDDNAKIREACLYDIAEAKRLRHPHICYVWASYTAGDAAYILSDFVPEHTLASFIAQRTPYQFMRVPQSERPIILLEWMHCLADALAMLHHRGVYHGAIRPSNILVDHDNCVAFADIGSLRTFQAGKKVTRNELSDCSAPETIQEPEPKVRGVHFADTAISNISTKRSSGSTNSGNSFFSGSPPKISSPILISSTSMGPVDSPMNSFSDPSMPPPIPLFRNFSRHLPPPPTFASASGRSGSPSRSRHQSYNSYSPPASPGSIQRTPLDEARVEYFPQDPGPSQPIPIDTTDPKRPCYVSNGTSLSASSPKAQIVPSQSILSDLLADLQPPRPLFIHKTSSRSSLSTLHKTSTFTSLQKTPTHTSTVTDSAPINPFATDIFLLGCVYLDLTTYIVKGHLSSLQKFRATAKAPLSTDPSTLHTWLAHLANEAQRLSCSVPILSSLQPILGVVRDMLTPTPDSRPSAQDVSARIKAALEASGLQLLCCANRDWDAEELQRARLSTRRESVKEVVEESVGSVSADGGAVVAESPSVLMRRSLSEGAAAANKGETRLKKLSWGWRKKG